MGTGGGRIVGHAAPQVVQELLQPRAAVPQFLAPQGQHGVQDPRHLARRQSGLLFLSASQPCSRKKCRSRHRVM